jgi:hypothetical protein
MPDASSSNGNSGRWLTALGDVPPDAARRRQDGTVPAAVLGHFGDNPHTMRLPGGVLVGGIAALFHGSVVETERGRPPKGKVARSNRVGAANIARLQSYIF